MGLDLSHNISSGSIASLLQESIEINSADISSTSIDASYHGDENMSSPNLSKS